MSYLKDLFSSIWNDSGKLKLFIGIGAAVLVLLIIVSISANRGAAPTCTVEKEIPEVRESDYNPIASADNRTLVRFAGYLGFQHGEDEAMKYIRLTPQSISISDREREARLILETDCSLLDFKIEITDEQYIFREIGIEVKTPRAGFKKCRYQFSQHIDRYEYWSCKHDYFQCTVLDPISDDVATEKRKIRAVLGFDFIEIELDGDPIAVAIGRFNKKQKTCYS